MPATPADPRPSAIAATEGWSGRFIGALAADLRWPFVGALLGGTQRLTPRVQLVASPPTENLDIPNEDARSVDLEDSNLFALNRFPGYDRWEDGVARHLRRRLGVRPARRRRSRPTIGQSYRLNNRAAILPPGTGLSDRFSDIVGRTTVRIGRLVNFIHRFRLDKDNFALRRNEIDADDRRPTDLCDDRLSAPRPQHRPAIEDLARPRGDQRSAAGSSFARYWSIFGSTVIDLTEQERGSAFGRRRLRAGPPPARHLL